MFSEIEKILFSAEEIQSRIVSLAAEITREYQGKDLTLIAIMNGSVMFLADLIRHIPLHMRLDTIGAASYHGSNVSSGRITITRELKLDVMGRHILLVDDILDSGRTLSFVKDQLLRFNPVDVRTCVLLDKQVPRVIPIEADFRGFCIPNEFVVGYGLDYAERFRNLPYIGVLKPESCKK